MKINEGILNKEISDAVNQYDRKFALIDELSYYNKAAKIEDDDELLDLMANGNYVLMIKRSPKLKFFLVYASTPYRSAVCYAEPIDRYQQSTIRYTNFDKFLDKNKDSSFFLLSKGKQYKPELAISKSSRRNDLINQGINNILSEKREEIFTRIFIDNISIEDVKDNEYLLYFTKMFIKLLRTYDIRTKYVDDEKRDYLYKLKRRIVCSDINNLSRYIKLYQDEQWFRKIYVVCIKFIEEFKKYLDNTFVTRYSARVSLLSQIVTELSFMDEPGDVNTHVLECNSRLDQLAQDLNKAKDEFNNIDSSVSNTLEELVNEVDDMKKDIESLSDSLWK